MEKTRLTVRLPPDLANEATAMAEYLGLTVNAFIVQAVRNWTDYQAKRAYDRRFDTTVKVPESLQSSSLVKPAAASRVAKVGPNQPCPCGSGQKYKRCHGQP